MRDHRTRAPRGASRLGAALALVALAIGAAGCTAGGPRSDGFAKTPQRPVAPGFGFDQFGRYAFGFDGARLRLTAVPAVDRRDRPVRPRMVLVAVHGLGEHAELTYRDTAELWARRGVTTYAYDQRGFGKNLSRGAWPGPDALVKDLAHVMKAVKRAHPDRPIGLIGHSMGGAVILTALGEGAVPEVDAAVALAPATLGGDQLPDYLRALLWSFTAVAPDRRVGGSGLGSEQITDNPVEQKRLDEDPHYLTEGSPREYLGVVRLMDRAVAASSEVRLPLLVMWGAKDPVMPGTAVRAAFARVPEGAKTYVEYPNGFHLLIRDKIGPKARAAAIEFLLREAPAARAKR